MPIHDLKDVADADFDIEIGFKQRLGRIKAVKMARKVHFDRATYGKLSSKPRKAQAESRSQPAKASKLRKSERRRSKDLSGDEDTSAAASHKASSQMARQEEKGVVHVMVGKTKLYSGASKREAMKWMRNNVCAKDHHLCTLEVPTVESTRRMPSVRGAPRKGRNYTLPRSKPLPTYYAESYE